MPYPPTTLPSNRSNTTPQFDNHPADHNAISAAVTDIVNELGTNPSGSHASVGERIQAVIDTKLNNYTDDMMQGDLNMDGHIVWNLRAPASTMEATNKAYVDGEDAKLVAKAGSTMTGNLNVGGDGFSAVGFQATPAGRVRIQTNDTDSVIHAEVVGAANVNGAAFLRFLRAGTPVGSITTPGPNQTQYNESSDPRLKEAIGPIDDAATRVQVLGRKAYRGRWKAAPESGEWDMVDATAVRDVAPYAVTGEPDAVTADGGIDPMQVAYGNLIPLLCSALANALDRIDMLEARLG